MNKRNDFICIGAVHLDYVLRLKQNYFKNRTNPIDHKENLGGVAFNIAKKLSFLNQKIKLYSLDCNKLQKKEIEHLGIKLTTLNENIKERYYASILDSRGKMILGLANMDDYEKYIDNKVFKDCKNKNIILDLNFSFQFIKNIINKNFKYNYICVCGTSAHKVYKINNLLKKIDTIILNKQESFELSNKKTINESLKYLIKKNKNLNIIITNGKNAVNAYINKINYLIYPPDTKIKNENGAGDALCAIFNYFFCLSENEFISLKKSICAGSLQASGYHNNNNNNNKKYLQKLDKLSKSIKIKTYKLYE